MLSNHIQGKIRHDDFPDHKTQEINFSTDIISKEQVVIIEDIEDEMIVSVKTKNQLAINDLWTTQLYKKKWDYLR